MLTRHAGRFPPCVLNVNAKHDKSDTVTEIEE